MTPKPRLYHELSSWWTLLSPPAEYADEAEFYASELISAGDLPARSMLELGSGGGNNASFLKQRFTMTLVDVSPEMLAVSRALNPECEHVEGDMRTVRLGRQFDRVFIHDAIVYMTSLADLRAAVETAYVHCRPGGAALFAPDYVREAFRPGTDHGGYDEGRRGLRYLEWVQDPDPTDSTYTVDYAYLLREGDGSIRVEHERHIEGLFSRAEWTDVLPDVGFAPRNVPAHYAGVEPGTYEVFIGVRALR